MTGGRASGGRDATGRDDRPGRWRRQAARLGAGLRSGWRAFNDFYDELFYAPWRSAVARERREQEDLFLLLCFSDLLGIPNPASYYTLELLPVMLERFHEWHLRQGMEKSPLEGFR